MSDVNANIGININASSALAELKALQRQIATFHQQVAKGSASAAIAQKGLQTNLLNAINATGKFHAQMGLVRTSTESFTHALESNKLSMGQYFKYAGASTKTFGKLFKSEFDTIAKVAQERVKKMQTQYIKMGKDAQGATKAMSITPHSLNMKDAATQTAIASQKQAIFNQLVRQGSTNLLNFGKNTQWAGRQLMVGFSVPLLYIGSVAAKVFMDLEKQAVRFKRVYGNMFTTSDETTRALADIQLLAKEFTKYGVAVTNTIKMAADAAAMGKTGAELTAQVAEATRLAVLGGVEQEKALETTISLTNAFGVSAKDLTSKINFLNAVENQTVVSIEDLTIAIPKAGPVVKQLGGDVEDLAFFLTAMKEGGINASEGANALKSGLASLINPSKKAAGMLGDLGINIKGIVEANQGDIRSTVIGFSQALDTLDPLNRARAIEQLFGKFQFSRLSTLFQNVTKDGTQASKVLQLAGASVEELAILSERELKTVEDAVGVNFRESIEKLKLTLVPIGKTFLEALTPVVKVIGNVLDKFNNLGDGTKKFIVIATGLVGFIGPVLLMTFGLLANGLANIIKLFLALRVGFLKMTGDSSSLAATTNYLTAEQLEATTVAASLNQAHTRLTQQFALETNAVSALRSAYVAATIAAAKFAMANPGMMASKRIPKKLARGTSKVPGYAQGTDTVPAMLTPGEAVIPAGTAQDPQFKPIIQAMLDGTIQKYEHGTGKVTQASKNSGTRAVVAFGAHQPFTTAHEDIANKARIMAKESGSQFIQYTSSGTESKKGVVSLENRIKQITESTGQAPSIAKNPFDVMKDLKSRGITDVKFLLGSDRMESQVFSDAAKKHGINLTKIEIPRVKGDNEVSATKLRNAVASGDIETANKLIAKGTSEETKKLIFDEIAKNTKTSKVTFADKEYNAQSATGAKNTQTYLNGFQEIKERSPYYNSTKGGRQYVYQYPTGDLVRVGDNPSNQVRVFDYKTILKGLEKYSGKEKLTASTLDKNIFHLLGSNVGKQRSGPFSSLNQKIKKQGIFDAEIRAVADRLKKEGVVATEKQLKNLTNIQASHLTKDLGVNGVKIWDPRNISSEPGAVNNYMNTVEKTLGKKILNDPKILEEFGINKKELQKLIDGEHPKTIASAKTLQKIAQYDLSENPKNIQALAVDETMKHRLETKFYKKGTFKTLAERFPDSKKIKQEILKAEQARTGLTVAGADLGPSQDVKVTKKTLDKKTLAEMKRIDADVRSSSMAKVKPTDFGKQIAKSKGYSFTGDRNIGGVYQKPDGTKVFVKPFVDEKSAKAELNMNKIHRKIGITTPEQVMKTMADPNNKRRKLIVLESAFDPRFAEEKMTGKFTKGQYFKQLTASLIRGDKDLKRGNVSGNIVTDTGASGVFDKASGRRDYSTNMKSMLGQAEINLLGAPGGRGLSKDFALSTENIPKGMTADQYHRAMIAEIERITPIVKETLRSIPMTNPNEAKAYRDMYRRLVKGKYTDWRSIHKMHSAVEPAFVTKKESFLDEKTGKIEKIKGEKKPKAAKPSTGKLADSKFTVIPPGKGVVQTPARRVGRYFVPAHGTAPVAVPANLANPFITQSQIAANMPVAQSKLVESMEKSTDANKKVAKESKNLKGKIASGANAIGLLTIGASFLDGKIAELAHKILPAVIGFQIFMMAINSLTKATVVAKLSLLKAAAKSHPYTAALLAIVTVLAAGTLIQKMINANNIKMAKKQSDYIDSISATTEKMKRLSAITGRYSASEVMSIKRQNASSDKFTKNYDRAGQQFGTTFAASELGKEIFKGFQDDLLRSGTGPAVKSFALQLSGLVSDGVITGIQAGDIARQVAVDFQDMSLYPKIVGDLTSIIGPDGSDILKDPIKVRLEIVKESQNNIESIINRVKGATTGTSSGGGKGASGVQGGRVAFTKSEAAIVGALAVQNLEITQAQIDATNYEYDKKLLSLAIDLKAAKTAKAKLDIQNQIKAAGDKNLEDNKKLNVANADNLKVMQEAFSLTKGDKAATRALMEGARQQARAKVKGTQSEPFLDPMLELAKGTGSKSLELTITALAGAGVNPLLLTNLMGMFKGDNDALTKNLDIMIKTHGAGEIQTLLSNLNIEKLEDKTKKELFLQINAVQDKQLFDDLNSTLAMLNTMPKDFNINAFLKGDAIGKLKTLTTQLNKANSIKDVSVKAVVDLIAIETGKGGPGKAGPDKGFIAALEAVKRNFDWIKSLPKNQQKTAMLTVITAYQEITPEQMKAETDKRIAAIKKTVSAGAPQQGQIATLQSVAGQAKLRDELTMLAAKEQYSPVPIPPKDPTDKLTDDDKKGSRDTTLDDLLLKLKLTRNASINAEGGLKELKRVFADGLLEKGFIGLSQGLLDQSGNLDFIDFVGGLSEATKKGFINTELLEKGIIKLSKAGDLAKKGYDAAALGQYNLSTRESTATIAAQRKEFKKLTDTGLDNVEAAEMLTDANFAIALSHTKNAEDVKILIALYKELKAAAKDYANDQLTPLQRAQKGFDEIGQKVNKFFSLARQAVEGKYARKIFDADKLVEEAQDAVDEVNKTIQVEQDKVDAINLELKWDDEIGQRVLDDLQEDVNDMQRGMRDDFDVPIQLLSDESTILSNDLALIDRAAGEINKKYNEQEEALSKISELNQDLIAQEKSRISLADALSQGDISAAAQIAQDMRSTAAAKAASGAGEILSLAREQEIENLKSSSGQTRLEIEKRQFEISQETYALEQDRKLVQADIQEIEDKIYDITEKREAKLIEIRDLEEYMDSLREVELRDATDLLRIRTEELDVIQKEKDAELEKLYQLELAWIEVQAGIAAAEAETIDLQNEILLAIEYAKQLAAIFAGMGKFNNLVTSGSSTSENENEYVTPESTAEDEAAAAEFDKIVAELDAAIAAHEAAVQSGNMYAVRNAGVRLDAAQKAYDAFVGNSSSSADAATAAAEAAQAVAEAAQAVAEAAQAAVSAGGGGGGGDNSFVIASSGGMVPKYMARGGMSIGSDTVPAMLTPGEFVMNKKATNAFGPMLAAINGSQYPSMLANKLGYKPQSFTNLSSLSAPTYQTSSTNISAPSNISNSTSVNNNSSSVYNYSVGINVGGSNANPQDIARAVMTQIKNVDSQRIRTQR